VEQVLHLQAQLDHQVAIQFLVQLPLLEVVVALNNQMEMVLQVVQVVVEV
jgi:hypothetical protein